MVTHLLFTDDLSLMSNGHTNVQTMLNKLRSYAEQESLAANTLESEVMCFNSRSDNLSPLYFDGTQLHYRSGAAYHL
eukprot:306726-Pelagomonas_calceolata.AAC.1